MCSVRGGCSGHLRRSRIGRLKNRLRSEHANNVWTGRGSTRTTSMLMGGNPLNSRTINNINRNTNNCFPLSTIIIFNHPIHYQISLSHRNLANGSMSCSFWFFASSFRLLHPSHYRVPFQSSYRTPFACTSCFVLRISSLLASLTRPKLYYTPPVHTCTSNHERSYDPCEGATVS